MPIARIDVCDTRSHGERAAIIAAVRRGIVDGLGAPNERVSIRLASAPVEDIDVIPPKTREGFVYVEVAMLEGRTPEIKRAMYDAIQRNLDEYPGVPGTDVLVTVREFPASDMS